MTKSWLAILLVAFTGALDVLADSLVYEWLARVRPTPHNKSLWRALSFKVRQKKDMIMILSKHRMLKLFVLVPFILLITSCAAGNVQFSQESPAGFWWGLWHGIISVISLIVHVFNESVVVYEIDNTGAWYDFGFLLGVILIWGGGCHASCKTTRKKQCNKEWEEIGDKVEKKVMRKLKKWAEEESEESDKEWEEIGEKVENKLKRKIREWAEKD